RMRRKPGDHHLRTRGHVEALAVDAARFEGTVLVMCHPPHVAIRVTAQKRVTGRRKLFWVAAATDIGNHGLGYYLSIRGRAVTPHHLAEARQISKGRRQSAAAHRHADGIDAEVSVFFAFEA